MSEDLDRYLYFDDDADLADRFFVPKGHEAWLALAALGTVLQAALRQTNLITSLRHLEASAISIQVHTAKALRTQIRTLTIFSGLQVALLAILIGSSI